MRRKQRGHSGRLTFIFIFSLMEVLSAKFRIFVQGDGQEQGRIYQQDGANRVLAISHVDAVFRRNEKKHDPQEFKRSENAEVPVKYLRESPQQDQK